MYKFSIQGCTHNKGKILKSQFSNTKYRILKAYLARKVKVKCLFHWGKVNKDSSRSYFVKLRCSGSLNRCKAESREQKRDWSSCYCYSWKLQDKTVKTLGEHCTKKKVLHEKYILFFFFLPFRIGWD